MPRSRWTTQWIGRGRIVCCPCWPISWARSSMRPADDERLRRWRLVLGQPAAEPTDAPLTEPDLGMDRVLEALYDSERKGGPGRPSPTRARPNRPTSARFHGAVSDT